MSDFFPDNLLTPPADGRLFSWGVGLSGRLGHGDESYSFAPKLVSKVMTLSKGVVFQQEVTFAQIWAGYAHSLVLSCKPCMLHHLMLTQQQLDNSIHLVAVKKANWVTGILNLALYQLQSASWGELLIL